MNQEQQMMVDAVRRVVLGQDLPAARADAHGLHAAALRQGLCEIGLPLLLVPECDGGLGAGIATAAAVAEEIGRHAVPHPSVEVLLYNPWQTELGAATHGDPGAAMTAAFRSACESPQALAWRARAALLVGAMMSGAMQQVLILTQRYATDRQQFGKPLTGFQVIQHQLAAMASQVAACQVAVQAGARALDHGDGPLAAAVAKARASDLVRSVVATAHQIHGAMGFTQEYSLHAYTTRLVAWRDEYGSELAWHEWLGRQAVRARGAGTWALIATDEGAVPGA